MLINLRTKFMRNIISKLLCKLIRSKTGYKIDIQLHEMEASFKDGEIVIHTNLEAKMDKQEFIDIIKSK